MITTIKIKFSDNNIKTIELNSPNAIEVKEQIITCIKEENPELKQVNLAIKFLGDNPSLFNPDNTQSRHLSFVVYREGEDPKLVGNIITQLSLELKQLTKTPFKPWPFDSNANANILSYLLPLEILNARVSRTLNHDAIYTLQQERLLLLNANNRERPKNRLLFLIATFSSVYMLIKNSKNKIERFAWGGNNYGQLGLSDVQNRYASTSVPMPEGFTLEKLESNMNGSSVYAMGKDAYGNTQLLAWGNNCYGQLGLSDVQNRYAPTLVPMPEGFTLEKLKLSGDSSVYALGKDTNGNIQLLAWGSNYYGQLGFGNNRSRNMPRLVPMPEGFTLEKLKLNDSSSVYALGKDANGNIQLLAWGNNQDGQLGLDDELNRHSPTLVPMPAGFTLEKLELNGSSVYALGKDANGNIQLLVWGYTGFGQLGLGDELNRHSPTLVPMPAGFTLEKLELTHNSVYALGKDANGNIQLLAWGNNLGGKLGLGDELYRCSPTLVPMPAGFTLEKLELNWVSDNVYALGKDANGNIQLLAWGSNSCGQLGLGDELNRHSPTLVPMPAGFTLEKLEFTPFSTYALGKDANGNIQLLAWGSNSCGQLGLGDKQNRHSPALVPMPKGFLLEKLELKGFSVYALGKDANGNAQLLAWGNNECGRLGVGDNKNRNAPTAITLSKTKYQINHILRRLANFYTNQRVIESETARLNLASRSSFMPAYQAQLDQILNNEEESKLARPSNNSRNGG